MYVVLQMERMVDEMLAMVASRYDFEKADTIFETFELAYDRAGATLVSEKVESFGHVIADGWLAGRAERCLTLAESGDLEGAAALATQTLQRAAAIRFPHPQCGTWRTATMLLERFESIEAEVLLAKGRMLRWPNQPTAEA